MSQTKKPLVVIVGPTASGKTSLAIEVAEKCNGEIICADSRTIYNGMDIGTAKPSPEDQARVPHWGINLVSPGEYFSVFDFKQYADAKISEIWSRGNVPIIVGGTGLYIDSIIFDYKFGEQVDMELRNRLNKLSLEELYSYSKTNNISLPENVKNKRYVVRSIERSGQTTSRRDKPIEGSIIVGLMTDRDILRQRIALRADQLFHDGVIDEASVLIKRYGCDNEAMKGNIYRVANSYLKGDITIEEMKNKNLSLDWQLAKRQMTWLKRNHFIEWCSVKDALKYIMAQLAKCS
jgi:tRNA dimethylallyltransferase